MQKSGKPQSNLSCGLSAWGSTPLTELLWDKRMNDEWMNEWMNEIPSLCGNGEFCSKATQCVSHFIYFIFHNEFIWPTVFWQISPRVPTRKLVFVSESVTPWHMFLEAGRPMPARIPAPAEKTAFLGGSTSPYHVPHLLSMWPLVRRPWWPGTSSDSNDSLCSCEWIHSSWLFCATVESSDLDWSPEGDPVSDGVLPSNPVSVQ